MKQFQARFEDEAGFAAWLDMLQGVWAAHGCRKDGMLFRLYTNSSSYDHVEGAVRLLEERFGGVPYAGITCFGAIVQGKAAPCRVAVTATLFEEPDSRVEVIQLPLTYETQEDSARVLLEQVAARPWVKAVEMMTTIGGVDMPRFCERVSELPEEVRFFGGGALASDVFDGHSDGNFVFSCAASHSTGSAVFVLQGGGQLHVQARYLTGWRKLGMDFEVTEAKNNVLMAVNGEPALELYQRYLHLPVDERFYELAVVFPFCFEHDGVPYLRVATAHGENGDLFLGADIKKGMIGNLAYGDPAQIRQSVNESLEALRAFSPQVIQLFSCGSRQLYWGADVDKETYPFEQLAPTSGFYTAGEFLRSRRDVLLHNVAMVMVALREGDAEPGADQAPVRMEEDGFSRPIMINNCLTSFINAATDELRRANEKLAAMAVTDGLTGLFNRTEVERRIRAALADYQRNPDQKPAPVVMMMDLDYFKDVNDTYGHQEGDEVLKGIAAVFKRYVERGDVSAVGRWGGEEFMFLLESTELQAAGRLADKIRETAAEVRFKVSGRHTLSAGITQATPRDTADTLTGRVDKGLYLAKDHGRDRSATIAMA